MAACRLHKGLQGVFLRHCDHSTSLSCTSRFLPVLRPARLQARSAKTSVVTTVNSFLEHISIVIGSSFANSLDALINLSLARRRSPDAPLTAPGCQLAPPFGTGSGTCMRKRSRIMQFTGYTRIPGKSAMPTPAKRSFCKCRRPCETSQRPRKNGKLFSAPLLPRDVIRSNGIVPNFRYWLIYFDCF